MPVRCFAQGGPPQILAQPQSQVATAAGQVTFCVSVSSITYVNYQWKFNGGNIPGATTSCYSIGGVQSANAGSYSVALTNGVGYALSANALLTVVTSPQSQTADLGANVSFSVTASSPVNYQWKFNGLDIPGASNSRYTITTAHSWDAGNYSVGATNSAGGVVTANALLTLNIPLGRVYAWGQGSAQTNVPSDLTNVLAIAAGSYHGLALKPDGTVRAWGSGPCINLPAGLRNVVAMAAGNYVSLALKSDSTIAVWGSGSGTNAPPGLTNITAIGAGDNHCLAVSNGLVLAWGANSSGQCNVPGGLSNVVAVAGGVSHSLALKADGTGAAWGLNNYGQAVWPADLSDAVAISAGDYFNVALRRDGTVRAWGQNSNNQTNVPPGLAGAVAVAAGSLQALALTNNGRLTPWGYSWGPAPATLTNVIAIDTGATYSIALLGTGSPAITVQPVSQTADPGATVNFQAMAVGSPVLSYQWLRNGINISGATNNTLSRTNISAADGGNYTLVVTNSLGRVTSSSAALTVRGSAPPAITGLFRSQSVVQGGPAYFLVTATGTQPLSYQWFRDGSPIASATNANYTILPAQTRDSGIYSVVVTNVLGSVTGLLAPVVVFLPPHTATAWGWDNSGQATVPYCTAGNPSPGGACTATQTFSTVGATSDPTEPDHCGYPACASYWSSYSAPVNGWLTIDTIGTAFNAILAVYTGAATNYASLIPVACSANHGTNGESVSFFVTAGTTYWIVIEGVNCATGNAALNFSLSSPGMGVQALAGGYSHTLALLTNGYVTGWGANGAGQLTPPSSLSNVTAIAAGDYHSLALKSDGTVAAWGSNTNGQGTVPAGLSNVVAISAGPAFNLALKAEGRVFGWGFSQNGEATGATNATAPYFTSGLVRINGGILSNVVAVAAGGTFSLALKDDGTVLGWGRNDSGQLNIPPGLSGVVALAAAADFGVALRNDGTVAVWGGNEFGQTNVPPDLTNVIATAAGSGHVLALRADGTITAWGRNDYGQTNVPTGLTNIVGIAAGYAQSLALQGDGSVVITAQPLRQRLPPGATATFAVMAAGDPPITYQWRLDGADILGANNSIFSTNASTASAGNYSVVVSNAFGQVISTRARLALIELRLSALGFSLGGFQVRLSGPSGTYVLQGSTDFRSWIGIGTNTLNQPGTVDFFDANATGSSSRFYRAMTQ